MKVACSLWEMKKGSTGSTSCCWLLVKACTVLTTTITHITTPLTGLKNLIGLLILMLWMGAMAPAQAQFGPGQQGPVPSGTLLPGQAAPALGTPGQADPADTVSIEPPSFKFIPFREWSRPAKAAFFSAIFPGLGQAYNRKYWKMPILYGGIGVIGYYVVYNNKMYNDFDEALRIRTDNDPTTIDQFADKYPNVQQLQRGRVVFRRYRDLSIIMLVGAHALNILDAHVDAHLRDFDIGDDLSFKIKPQLLPIAGNQISPALTLKLNF
jgi:hypothetical protein